MSTTLILYQKTLGHLVENSVEYVNNLPSPRFIKSHLPLPLLPSQLDKIKPKIVYTCRHPKDVAVSSYFHFRMVHNFAATFDDFCDLMIKGLTPLGNLWPHYLDFWHKRQEPNILFLRYEDMKRDLKGTLIKLAKFLEKDYTDAEYDQLGEYLSFQSMRKNKACNLEDMLEERHGKGFFQKVGDYFIRKGQVGDWKNHMSPELSKKFDDWIEANTKGTGLTFD